MALPEYEAAAYKLAREAASTRAAEPTAQSLYREVTGLNPAERISEDDDADGEVINALCDAWERGASDARALRPDPLLDAIASILGGPER